MTAWDPANPELTHADAFSGAGGAIWAARLIGLHTKQAIEQDPKLVAILRRRQEDGSLPAFSIHDGPIENFSGGCWHRKIDLLTGGPPCTPFSVAGKRLGPDDPRDRIPDFLRLVGEIRPRVILMENSPALAISWPKYWERVLGEFDHGGYAVAWVVLSAATCGAPHIRRRLWILAIDTYADRGRLSQIESAFSGNRRALRHEPSRKDIERVHLDGSNAYSRALRKQPIAIFEWGSASKPVDDGETSADAYRQRLEELAFTQPIAPALAGSISAGPLRWWSSEPPMGRVAYGVADWRNRIKALGLGWVPVVAISAGRYLMSHLRPLWA